MQLNGFIGPSYTLQSTAIECQRSVNLYPQVDESGVGRNVASLLSTPGLKLFANLGAYPSRGMITTSMGRVFAVCHTTLYELFADGTSANRGTLLTQAGRVGIADNGRQLMIVDGPNGYNYDLATNGLTAIAAFPGGVTVAFQDSYFIFNVPNTQQFYITGQYETTVDPLDFASAEGNPDNLVAILSDNRHLWLFGTQSVEIWFNSGAELFPFSRIDGAYITQGTQSPFSPAKLDNTVFWLGQDESGTGIAYSATGFTPTRISTFAMEQTIARYPTIADATGFTYQQDGHNFYCLNFPTGNATWVYDDSSQLWHERAYTAADGSLQRARPETHVVAFNKHLAGDYLNGNIYHLDPLTYTDNGNPITRLRTSPYVSDNLKNLFISRIQLDIQTGLQADGNAPIPQCMLQWSDDGGMSWSNEHWTSLGAIGAFKTRAIWRRLGTTRQRVFRFKITDPVPVAITDALIHLEAGHS